MGVTKGFTFIDNSYANRNTSIKEIYLNTLGGLRVAVDFTGMLHRFMREKTYNENHYILELINIIEKFKKCNIIPIFVIDGRPVPEKQTSSKKNKDKSLELLDTIITSLTIETNQNTEDTLDTLETLEKINKLKKKSISITKEHIDKCKHIFDNLNCLYIHNNKCEADSILALLVKLNITEYVYSEDFDMCLYSNVKYILKGLNFMKDTIKLYNRKDILENLDITSNQLIDIAFLTGTDYNHGLYKSTMDSNLELIKKYETIEGMISNIELINTDRKEKCKILIPTYNFDYTLVRNIFTLKNIDETVTSTILKYINHYNGINYQNKQALMNIFNIKKILNYIKTISEDQIASTKYSKKFSNYCYLQFGINISIECV